MTGLDYLVRVGQVQPSLCPKNVAPSCSRGGAGASDGLDNLSENKRGEMDYE